MTVSRHQFAENVYINAWEVTPVAVGVRWGDFRFHLASAYTDFRLRDHSWRFRAEELWAVKVGLAWETADRFFLEIEGNFIPELVNRDEGNANGFDGYRVDVSTGVLF
jgi:hypothetical protein